MSAEPKSPELTEFEIGELVECFDDAFGDHADAHELRKRLCLACRRAGVTGTIDLVPGISPAGRLIVVARGFGPA